ncbi:MAG: GspE/PulE family protein [Patescibacteria group bacterium]
MLDDKQIKEILLGLKLTTKEEFPTLEKDAKKAKMSLEQFLYKKKIITEESLYEMYAKQLDVPFVNLKEMPVRKDILFTLPEPLAQTHQTVSFDATDDLVKIATLKPDDIQMVDFLQKTTDKKIKVYLTTPSALQESLKQYQKSLEAEFKDITKVGDDTAELTEADPEQAAQDAAKGVSGGDKDLHELAQDLPVIRIVDTLLEYAIFEQASDIHIEPMEKNVLVRYRIDGILRDVMTLPKSSQTGIVARIKILSNLKLDEHRLPQDGRFKVEKDNYKVAFRVSIIPVYDGEKIVMRLLNESGQVLGLEDLGFQPKPLELVKANVKKPHGMILVTGPTGSGKTTTLYTVMNILNSPEVNIATVEDPIEYHMPRINQSQINPKIDFTFAAGLRSLLRQDPDIIMVGEIRDLETAEISIHAAMTGHLVLSTLHTNSAVATIPRLLDMGIAAFLVASTTNIIIAQRLVRKICQDCITSYNLTEEMIKDLEAQFDVPDVMNTLEREKIISDKNTPIDKLLFYRGKGCKKCGETGYKGRIGIYEVLEVTDIITKLIMQKAAVPELRQASLDQGMLRMIEDGFIKAKNGVTTIEEILRVSKQ